MCLCVIVGHEDECWMREFFKEKDSVFYFGGIHCMVSVFVEFVVVMMVMVYDGVFFWRGGEGL